MDAASDLDKNGNAVVRSTGAADVSQRRYACREVDIRSPRLFRLTGSVPVGYDDEQVMDVDDTVSVQIGAIITACRSGGDNRKQVIQIHDAVVDDIAVDSAVAGQRQDTRTHVAIPPPSHTDEVDIPGDYGRLHKRGESLTTKEVVVAGEIGVDGAGPSGGDGRGDAAAASATSGPSPIASD